MQLGDIANNHNFAYSQEVGGAGRSKPPTCPYKQDKCEAGLTLADCAAVNSQHAGELFSVKSI